MDLLAREQYLRQQRRALRAAGAAKAEWLRIGNDFDRDWRQIGPRLTLLVTAAQVGSAADAAAFVDRAVDVRPEAQVVPGRFAGVASDGRSLDSLLYGAVVTARSAKAGSLAERVQIGSRWLGSVVQTQVADAGRDAQQAAVVARPRVQWVRIVNAPCCQRCAVLSGRVYQWSEGFQRHPNCDCTMLPQTVANPESAGVIGPEGVTDLTRLQREAIDSGRSFNQVINDYNRNGKHHAGDYLPPSRVSELMRAAGTRQQAQELLQFQGLLAKLAQPAA